MFSKKPAVVFLLVLGLLITLTSSLIARTPNVQTPDEPPRPRLNVGGLKHYPETSANDFLHVPSEPQATYYNGLIPWSSIVFQSSYAGNWDIHFASTQLSTRLTNDPATDIHPRLNVGATRIVFASNRDGDYELFSINPDGSDLSQLTHNQSDDVNPTWSHDGTKIAFQAYRDGQPEIYVMDSDGSNQIRLTNHPDYDGMPSWSPTGTKLAFSSRRTGGYRIYVINADGSNLTRLSDQPYSLNPTWSKVGGKIAYDADGDNDGWQELWAMKADGSNQHREYSPGSWYDARARSWSPDGRYIAYTRIQYSSYQGVLYWDYARLRAWDTFTHNVNSLRHGDQVWEPDWQMTDINPPTANLNELPPLSRKNVTVSWDGVDAGDLADIVHVSGLKSYEVQFRDTATSTWNNWLIGTTASSALFSETAGNTYTFRVRATDNAGNTGLWSADFQNPEVTLYSWVITGTIRDNTGTPVTGAVASTNPAAIVAEPSDGEGKYISYVGPDVAAYDTTWGKSGYSPLPATTFPASSGAGFDVFLPPGDNVIQDSGFESGMVNAGKWWTTGITAVVTSNTGHTGNFAAVLSPGLPQNAAQVSESSQLSANATMEIGHDDRVHMAWNQVSEAWSTQADVFYSHQALGGSWITPENVSNSTGNSISPQLKSDKQGGVHVIWTESISGTWQIFYNSRNGAGVWSSPQPISADTGMYTSPQLVVHDDGTVYAVWEQKNGLNHEIYTAERNNSGVWLATKNFTNDAGYDMDPGIALSAAGTVHLIWGNVGHRHMYAAHRELGGSWSAWEPVAGIGGLIDATRIVADNNGIVHAAWLDGGRLQFARRDLSGVWTYHEDISTVVSISSEHQVDLAVSENGTSHLLYWANGRYRYRSLDANGAWSSELSLPSSAAEYARLAADRLGGAHLVWAQRYNNGPPRVVYLWVSPNGTLEDTHNLTSGLSKYPENIVLKPGTGDSINVAWNTVDDGMFPAGKIYHLASQPGDSAISQVVTVPASISMPTLSYLYQINSGRVMTESLLSLQIDNGNSVSTIYADDSVTNSWVHVWHNLGAWSGQTITLTFKLQGVSFSMRAILDEVALGSAGTDAWVDISGPSTALPGEEVVHHFTYGNRSAIDASGVAVSVTLPAGLTYQDASVTPTATTPALVWDIGDLPAGSGPFTITITSTVSPVIDTLEAISTTAVIDTTAPELETANNTAAAAVFIGRYAYLPVIAAD